MSTNPATDLNLEELFQPAWARESDSKNPYSKYEPRERPDRGDRRDRPREGGFNRPRGDNRGERRPSGGPDRGRGPRRGFHGQDRSGRPERREPLPPPPEVNVALHADDLGAESLARQIKTTGRAYPLFDIARMILQKPERYLVEFSSQRGSEGQALQPLFVCALDDTVWLSLDEAVSHVLQHHRATFYQTERTETDPPKGTYTFVAQCGMSGEIFGPPNHHDYQNKLREHHARRFSRMPFEAYKARVKIVRDEAVVKKWIEDQSWKTEYVCLNVPEAARLADMAAVEKHFREVHQATILRQVDTHSVPGPACQKLRGGLYRLYREQMDDQRRFPMQIASSLSQQFASRGLQFFKVNKTVTHVWVARPTHLDLETSPVSDGIRSIVQFIEAHPKCTRRQVVESIAPAPAVVSPSPAAPAVEAAPVAESGAATASAPTESESQTAPAAAAPKAPPAAEPTPEQTAIISDLHWLIHQGHVIEFANGTLETAKKPLPKPQPKPAKKVKAAAEAKPEAKAEGEPVALVSTAPESEDGNAVIASPSALAPAPAATPAPVSAEPAAAEPGAVSATNPTAEASPKEAPPTPPSAP